MQRRPDRRSVDRYGHRLAVRMLEQWLAPRGPLPKDLDRMLLLSLLFPCHKVLTLPKSGRGVKNALEGCPLPSTQ